METVQEYVESFGGIGREWLDTLMTYMHKHHPELRETLSYQIPTFKFGKMYIAFSLAKTHFSLHTLDFEMIEQIKGQLPQAKYGKGCVKVKYANREEIPTLFQAIDLIVERNS